jgi:hypothetical protein
LRNRTAPYASLSKPPVSESFLALVNPVVSVRGPNTQLEPIGIENKD